MRFRIFERYQAVKTKYAKGGCFIVLIVLVLIAIFMFAISYTTWME